MAPVYLTAVLEYLVAEVLEQAGILAGLMEKDRVIPKHIRLAITNDEGKFAACFACLFKVVTFILPQSCVELNKLCPKTIYTGSGGGRDYFSKSKKESRWDMLEEDDDYTTVLKPTKMRQKSKSSKRKEEFHDHAELSEPKEFAEDIKEDNDDAMTLSDVSDVDNLDDYLEDEELNTRVKDRSGSEGEVSYFRFVLMYFKL